MRSNRIGSSWARQYAHDTSAVVLMSSNVGVERPTEGVTVVNNSHIGYTSMRHPAKMSEAGSSSLPPWAISNTWRSIRLLTGISRVRNPDGPCRKVHHGGGTWLLTRLWKVRFLLSAWEHSSVSKSIRLQTEMSGVQILLFPLNSRGLAANDISLWS